MSDRKKPGGRREPPGGRPPKGNVRLVSYVQAHTRQYIDREAERLGMTLGEVVDNLVLKLGALSSEMAWQGNSHHGRFEVREDEDTGRRYWWGSEDGWKDPTEVGENGVIMADARHFEVGTIIKLTEPNVAISVAHPKDSDDIPQHKANS